MTDTRLALANDLRQACQQISRRVRYEGTHELAPHQFSVLARLRDTELTPRELADIERVSAPSMTKTVNCLVDLGLARRRPHPGDGRQVLVSRTPAGDEAFARIAAQRDTFMMRQLAGLTADEIDLLARATEILKRVAAQ